ncbi:MAG: hypothetical protein IPG04_38910 [Polyangiaceae bacterium]|nr:hypothetical protein [Polyangiaceae bacterium]
MQAGAFEAALRAAAKVTLGTALFGCGAIARVSPDETEAGAGGRGGAEPTGLGGVGGRADEPSVGGALGAGGAAPVESCQEPASGWAAYEPATFACCTAAVDAAAPADPESSREWGFHTPEDPMLDGCCAQILTENYDALWSGSALPHPVDDGVLAACCVRAHGNAGCTPWGPPCPPALDDLEPVPWVAGRGDSARGVA